MEEFSPFLSSIIGSVSTVAVVGGIAFFCRKWLLERIKASIKHEYDLKILELESQKEIRLKGEIVSELLAEWIRKEGFLDYNLLNKLSFQAYIWLPKDLAEDLSNSLANKDGAKDVRLLLNDIRTYLQGEDDGLESKHAIVFDEPDLYGRSIPTSRVTSCANAKPKPVR
ncbi:hypothetical protein [Shewanella sp. MF08487]|uniref:hypothetical protein n=1 Tax=Shewanella TaxID=22 RepID=UPI003D79E0F5